MGAIRNVLTIAVGLLCSVLLLPAARAQAPQAADQGARMMRDTLLGLLNMDQVQKELKLTEEQIGKVKAVSEKLRAEMSSQFAAAREIEDRAKRRAKTDELRDQLDRNAREQLGDTLSQEQMRRLFQIRMQVRPVVESLARQRVAERLKLTDDQKKKVADINKDTQAKQSELFAALRGASDERRTELFQKLRQARADADQQALAVLTAEQKTAFQEMQGAKIELPTSRGPR